MLNQEHLAALRKEYRREIMNPDDLSDHPIDTFRDWFELALAEVKSEPNAMVLSTVNSKNRPTSRIVLIKDFSLNGFVFFTNYHSHKGKDLDMNPFASLNFFWSELERQVRIEGKVQKVSEQLSNTYFQSRPRLSQAGAIVSNQSEEISDRTELDANMKKIMDLPEQTQLEMPKHWGGYQLEPDYFEFWQGRAGRVHDRICYELNNDVWRKFRLSP
jgi:pyridoxamine 5'-phosphate oxidase